MIALDPQPVSQTPARPTSRPTSQSPNGMACPPRLRVRAIDDPNEAQALAPAWDTLVARSPAATPFSSAAWNLACWRQLGRGRLLVLAFEGADELVGIAPLYLEPGPHRRLRWIGMLAPPTWRHYPVADYADLAAAPGFETEVVDAFRAWLDAHRKRWRTLDLGLLPATGVLAPRLAGRAAPTPLGTSLVMGLPTSWREYVGSVSPNLRPALERIPRKLQRERDARYERVTSVEELPAALDDLIRLHSDRWTAEGLPGVFSCEETRSLVRDAAARFLALGWLQLWRLQIDGEVAAVQFNLRLGSTVYFWSSGYQTGTFDLYSPGRTLMAHTIRTAIVEGARTYDFLRGDHTYKRRFGAEAVPLVALHEHTGPLARIGLGGWDLGVGLAKGAYHRAEAWRRSS
ncbi:MAG: GNAT family N-acetyltransferase [Chloroflexi bacterium]|nr:GNAT family N-acetyltransferase [Chloroflexota bacterium]